MYPSITDGHRPSARRRRLALTGMGAAALTAGALLLAAPASAQTPAPPTGGHGAHRATEAGGGAAGQALDASIEPSVVQLYIEWSGYVGYPTDDGTVWSDPVSVAMICTGFFVSDTGQIATAGHCVDPVEGRHALIDSFLQSTVEDGWMTADDAASLTDTAYANWPVEGQDAGSDAARTIYAVQPKAVDGIAIEDPLAVQLVDFRPFEEGDVALLKADVTGTTPLPVSADDPTSGTAVTSVGFPASVQSVVDATRVRASFKTGSVSSQQISEQGVPRTEINADLSGGMSGGPTVDALGNVVGINSSKIVGDQSFNFITDASDLRDWLSAKGVALASVKVPAPEPTTAPAAPSDEHGSSLPIGLVVGAGAALLLVVGAVVVVVVLVTRRKRATPATVGGPAPLGGEGLALSAVSDGAFTPGTLAEAPAQPQRPTAPVGATPPAPPAPVAQGGSPTGYSAPTAPLPAPPATAGFAPTALAAPTQPLACPSCGTAAGAGQRFCGTCGAGL